MKVHSLIRPRIKSGAGSSNLFSRQKQRSKGIHAATDQLLPDCGHSPHLENPEATLQAMQQVLQDWGVLA